LLAAGAGVLLVSVETDKGVSTGFLFPCQNNSAINTAAATVMNNIEGRIFISLEIESFRP